MRGFHQAFDRKMSCYGQKLNSHFHHAIQKGISLKFYRVRDTSQISRWILIVNFYLSRWRHPIFIILLQVRVKPEEKTPGIAILMSAYAILTTVVYLVNKNPVFHEVMYGILVFGLLGMDWHLTRIQRSSTGLRIFLGGFFM